MDSFCDVFLKKRFIKCISKKDDTCYLFTGRIPSIKSIITKIKKNKGTDEKDSLENVTDDEIQKLFDYLRLMKKDETTDTDDQRKAIKETMFLDKYSSDKLIFVNESIDGDDTNEIIIRKIIYNCYKDKNTTSPYIYAWYEDGTTNRNTPVQFKYEDESTEYLDFYGRIPKECIDSSLIDSNGDRIPRQTNNKNLTLYEKSINPSDVIYFFSLEEYLDKKNMFETIGKYTEEEIKTKKEIKSFINGLVLKYWPELSYQDILFYRSEASTVIRKAVYEKQKAINDIYNTGVYIVESEFLGKDVNEKIQCGNYSLTMMRLTKLSTKNNTVHLSKIFTDFFLKEETPFIKLLLDSHDDAFYKLYEKSLLYEGSDKTNERHITKDRCKEWSDGYNIQTEYGYNYLHSGNVVLIKIYNVGKDIYGTLIIHFDGNIECIIEHNDRELREEDIIEIIHDCNVVLTGFNLKQFYAFERIDLLDEDIKNVHSETKVDFLNAGMMFRKEDFQDKKKKIFPNWNKYLGTFIQNFPMFLRVKTFEETENDSQIIGRYNRVDNYANITTIQSAIAAYKVIFEDPEIIIQKLSKDYNKDVDFIRKEYETWEELMSMKEGFQRTTTVINEGGSEIKIWLNQKEDLVIELQNMKSFEEQRRIFVFIKTMMNLYLSYITDKVRTTQRRLFESVDAYNNSIYDEEEDEELLEIDELQETIESRIKEDDLEALLDGLEDDDELERLLDDSDDEIDFDQLGGGNDSDGYFETKSYYLKRLKKYDKDLFVFRSRQDRAGILYGYPRLCGAVDDRHPIAVTDKELERINNSSEEGSGRKSYSEAISVPRRDKNVKYICPKYWDISRSLSIRPDAVNKKDIIPAKLPKGSNGRTSKSILERSAIYWTDANEVKYYAPDIREESKQLHPMGYGLPCCFNASKRKKKQEEPVTGEGYISNKDPVGEGKYAHLHPYLLKIFNQNEKTFTRKERSGFLRKGVKQNDNDYIFNTSPFLQSYFKILEKRDKISEEMFIEIIKDDLKKNLDKFQKCPLIHQKFRKPFNKVTDEDESFIEDVLDKEETKLSFPKKTIQRLKEEMKTGVLESNETCYLYQLLLSLKNYLDFLKSDENRDDTYILPLLILLYGINIVIFENIDDEIKIKVTNYTNSEKIGFIYKHGNNYEPILYRYYDKVKKEITEEYLFTQNLLKNDHYQKIISSIKSKIDSHKSVSKIEEYEKIITEHDKRIARTVQLRKLTDEKLVKLAGAQPEPTPKQDVLIKLIIDHEFPGVDSIQSLFIDNYSNVSYLITKKGNILPIIPEPIPSHKKYKYIYSFLEIQDIKVGMNVTFGPANSKFQGTITKPPFGRKGKEKIEARDTNGRPYNPGIWYGEGVCFLDEKVCMQKLPTYDTAVEYLSLFNKHFQIKSVIVSEEDNISTIVLSNGTYLPVREENNISSKYNRITAESMVSVDRELYTMDNIDDERKKIINEKKYEDYITTLGIHHIISRIQETSVTVTDFVKDGVYYRVGEKIHFTKEEDDFIEKIDKTDHLYSQYKHKILKNNDPIPNNISSSGTITEMEPKGNEKYPKREKVTIEIQLTDQIDFVLSDPIMIDSHKKIRLFEILEPHIDGLFHTLKEKDYQKHELEHFITLCNREKQTCNYPCTKGDQSDKTGCKLYVVEKGEDGKLLIEKIKWKFIEKLIIFGIDNKDKIIDEKVSVHELRDSANIDEKFYTFSEFKSNILHDIFIKKSKYIMNTVENRIVQRRNIVMKKLDKIPYFIHKLFGTGSSVVFNLTKDNKDFLTLEKALKQAGVSIDKDLLRKILIDELEAKKHEASFLKKYPPRDPPAPREYSDVSEIIREVNNPDYRIQNPDIELILQNLSKGNNLGILLVSSKLSSQKKNNVYFYHTGLDTMDVETARIIPLYHTLYEGEFILSNIVIEHIGELKYYTTIRELYDVNVLHKKWIKI